MRLHRHLWFALGMLMLALGIIGALLPVMPTTIFLILAATCFGRSSPRLEARLLAHPRYGRALRVWREQGAITVRGKRLATTGIAIGIVLFWLGARPAPLWGVPVGLAMAACAAWLLARPLPRGEQPGPVAAWTQRHPHAVAALGSAGLHLLLLWIALGGRVPDAPIPPPPEERIALTLLPAAAPPVPVAAQEAPQPTPERQAMPERAPPSPPVPQPSPAAPPPLAARSTRPIDMQATAPPAEDSEVASASEASMQAAPPSPSLPPAPQLAGNSDPNWEGEVLAWLENFRRYPRQARVRRQQGVVYVRALVDGSGRVLSRSIAEGSGHRLLDQEAMDTFDRAGMLPPPPATLRAPVVVRIPVLFSLR